MIDNEIINKDLLNTFLLNYKTPVIENNVSFYHVTLSEAEYLLRAYSGLNIIIDKNYDKDGKYK